MDITNVAPRDIEYSTPKPTEQPTPGTSSHDAAEGAKKPPRFSVRNNLFMWALTAAEIVASILVVQWVTSHGGTEFAAYLWSMLPPLVGGVIYWAKTRVLGGASLAILVFNLLSAGVALLGSHDAKVLLYKDCFVTGIIAVIFAASTVVGKPVTYWYGQRFATGGTPEGLAWWRDLWANVPGFRKLQRQVCLVWAAILMIEAGSKAFAISQNSFDNAYVWTQVLPIAAIVLGMVMTMRMVRRTLARVRSTPASSDRSYR
ncbi:VC0807 family protein [Kocuria massiliensis]|uniref:VC0807 family protein n=1 Tax=Kocuria massiliensis TaxID=1926282 RepID=UPI000A1CCD5E|nr:VC0807 family protein [Kocuria massiliensis]